MSLVGHSPEIQGHEVGGLSGYKLAPLRGKGREMNYHKITRIDCLSVATKEEKVMLGMITNITLLKNLSKRWCEKNKYKLGGYLGNDCWDSIEA